MGLALTYAIGKKIQEIISENLRGEMSVIDEVEMSCKIKSFTLVGHVDLQVETGAVEVAAGGRSYLLEIKSMNPADFQQLRAPLMEHEQQCQAYLWLASHADDKGPGRCEDFMIIGYVSKGHLPSPIEWFTVFKDPSFDKGMKDVIKALKQMDEFPDVLPDKVCGFRGSPMSRGCVTKDKCFQEGQ